MTSWIEIIQKNFPEQFFPNFPLYTLSRMQIGGRGGGLLFLRNSTDVKKFIKIQSENCIPFTVLGNGSNTIFQDRFYPGVIVKLKDEFEKIEKVGQKTYFIGAGVKINHLMKFLEEENLAGMEELAGIPGTIGGSLTMNAGANNYCIGDSVTKVWVWEGGGEETISPDFSYRRGVNTGGIILGCWVRLIPSNKEKIKKKIREIIQKRKEKFPLKFPSCGCVFKNPSKEVSAGYLIEKAGLKGRRIGGVMVSPLHANFIVKIGPASFRDFITLVELIKREVEKKFGILLDLEVVIV
ncbi:MAG TPA: UDP-N-acetylmuramate dehydrogenase [bacterium]|nr:UDP-N-acetylmuramate dehydrogenase [bacterium]HEX68478.1 UDP-N-acetylmuramate dehydrogenase [bacterium]